MGSTGAAIVTTYLCRLCARAERFVVPIFGDDGTRLQIAQKIRNYLPISISEDDLLPKTICVPCLVRLEIYVDFVENYRKAQNHLNGLISSIEDQPSCSHDTNIQSTSSLELQPHALSSDSESEEDEDEDIEEDEEELEEEEEEEEEEDIAINEVVCENNS